MGSLLGGKTAWVTGAAGALGAAICRRFADEGANIALSGRNVESLQQIADDLNGAVKSQVFVMDVINRQQVDATAKEIFERFGADKGADIPSPTEYVQNLKPLLQKYGNEAGLNIILFTLDETTYT